MSLYASYYFVCAPRTASISVSSKISEIHNQTLNSRLKLNAFSQVHSYEFSHKGIHEFADYCIPKNLSEKNFDGSVLLVGERKFLYEHTKKNQNLVTIQRIF